MSSSSYIARLASGYRNFCGPPTQVSNPPPNPTRKRRMEEVLGLDVECGAYNKMFRSSKWRPDKVASRERYMKDEMREGELSTPYLKRGDPFHRSSHLAPLSDFNVPAFSGDHIDEFGGKIDLIMNTITSLYGPQSPPLEPNKLMFHYTGLIKSPLGDGRDYVDDMKYVIEMGIYGDDLDGKQADRERNAWSRSEVHDAFRVHLADQSVEPVVTMLPFNMLQSHIKESNNILKAQYAALLKGASYSELKATVVNQHGADSVVALLVQMNSPEDFMRTFVPRGILASRCTGKTTPFSSGTTYQGIVTLQTAGTLHVDTEDGDHHWMEGNKLETATLYLIVEMQRLVPHDDKFNYPFIRMLLTPKTTEQVEADIISQQGGKCVRTRDGGRSKTIIKPLAQLRGSSYYIHATTNANARQSREFSIIMAYQSSDPKYICFQE